MQKQCIDRVAAHLGRELTPAEIKRIDEEFLGEQQRMRREDPAKWASMTTAERVTESAKRVMEKKARESRQKQLTTISNEAGLVRQLKGLEENAANYEGAGRYGQGAHDLLEGIATQVRGAEVSASVGMDAVLTEALKTAKAQGAGGDAQWGSWLMFGSRKSDATFADVVRSIMGEDVANAAAKVYGKMWSARKEEHRQLLNRNGGNIGYLDHFMEAMHNPRIMQKIGRDAWVEFWMARGDWKRMHHPTGEDWGFVKAGNTAEMDQREFLNEAFATLITGGVNKTILQEVGDNLKAAPGGSTGGGASANLTKSPGHRVLHLKDAQAIIDYNTKFSDRSLGQVFTDSLVRTASDAHLVSVAGANPSHTLSRVLETAKVKDANAAKEAGFAGDHKVDEKTGWVEGAHRTVAIDKMNMMARSPDHAFNTLFAASDAPGKIDRVFSMYSMWSAATKLLFTPVRAIFQDTEQILQHAWHTQGTSLLNMAQGFRSMNVGRQALSAEARADLNRFGIALGAALEKSREYGARMKVESDMRNRDLIKLGMENAAERAATAQQKFSMLKFETDAMRTAGEHINALALGGMIEKDWAALRPQDRSMLTRAGIQESQWHLYQQMPVAEIRGGGGARAVETSRIMDHPAFEHLSNDERFSLANTVTGFIRNGGDITTSEYSFQAKTMVGAVGNTGFAKQLMLFKNAPAAQAINMARRLEHLSVKDKIGFAIVVGPRMTTLGYMAIATVALLNGQRVPDPSDPKTFIHSVLASGGLSMIGETIWGLVDPEEADRGSGMIPILSDAQNLGMSAYYAVTGEGDKAKARVMKFGRQQLPFLNMWYSKTPVSRWALDDMMEGWSPGYLRRQEGFAGKRGTPFFWHPGEAAPNLEEATQLGESQ